MQRFSEIFQDLVVKRLDQVYQFIIQVAPKVALAVLILIIGWFFGLLLKKITSKLLKALGFDVLSEKTGLKRFLEKGGIQRSPSSAVGLGFYWLIVFSALVMAFDALELEVASQMIRQGVLYLPKIVAATVLLIVGIFLSKFINKFVEKSLRLANIPMYGLLGKTAGYIVIGFSAIAALEYLGVSTALIVQYGVIFFVVVPLVLVLIFLIGGRDIVASMLAARVLSKEYAKGDKLAFDSISGEVESIGFTFTRLRNNKEEIIIPNSELVTKIVKRVNRGE